MKKINLAIAAILLFSTAAIAQEQEAENTVETSANTYTIQKVAGPGKESNLEVFTITYPYSAEDMEEAIISKLKSEGLSESKAKNNFHAFKESKYNSLWPRTFDLYIAVNGSVKSGTIYFVMSTGYDNYLNDSNAELNKRISAWLTAIESDIQIYIHNNKIEDQEKKTKDAEKEVNSLKKKKESIEKKISANEAEIKKFEAQKTVVEEGSTEVIDPKILEKEQKTADKLTDKKNKLQYDLDDVTAKLEKAEKKYNEENDALKELKANRPN